MAAGEPDDPPNLRKELTELLNRHSQENRSNTPDYILSDFMLSCLTAFDNATNKRDKHKKG